MLEVLRRRNHTAALLVTAHAEQEIWIQLTHISGCVPDHRRYTEPYSRHFSEFARPFVKRSMIKPLGYFHFGPEMRLLWGRSPGLNVARIRDVTV